MTSSERQAIVDLLAEEDAAWNSGDAEAFAKWTLADISFTNVVGMFSVGREPFIAQHRRIFSTIYKGSHLRQVITNLAIIRHDVMIVDSMTYLEGFHALPPGVEAVDNIVKTRLAQVVVFDDNHWRVASFHNVAINPAMQS